MLKFTMLTENQETDGLEAEHGLSFYIEYNGKNYLLDAGQSDIFVKNADRLGLETDAVDAAVLSHAHYDHADGFAAFCQRNTHAQIYARAEGMLADCYSVGSERTRYIGIAPGILKDYKSRFCWVGDNGLVQIPEDSMNEKILESDDSGRPKELIQTETVSAKKGMQIADGVWLIPHFTSHLDQIGARMGMYRYKGKAYKEAEMMCRMASDAETETLENRNPGNQKTADQKPVDQKPENRNTENRNIANQNTADQNTENRNTENQNTAERSTEDQNTENQQEKDQQAVLAPDDFAHEQSLVFETDEGLVIFNSCSHGGVANIVNEVRTAFPGRRISAYIGGFHLKAPGEDALNCTEDEVAELGRSLMALGIRRIYTGHCTGRKGYEILKRVMGDVLQRLYPGLRVEL